MATTRKQAIEGMRRAFEKVKHHEKFTGRVKKAFEAELSKCTIYIGVTPGAHADKIEVWGDGIDYNDSVSVSLWQDNARPTWQEQFTYGLAVADRSDYEEREAQEAALRPQLDKIERAILALREKAAGLIAALPVPASATIRAESHFWTNPRPETSAAFPHCFKSLAQH